MLKLFRSFSNTPYAYDSLTNDFYRIDEHVFEVLDQAGEKLSRCSDEKVRKTFEDAGVVEATLPLQTPDLFKAEIEKENLGMRKLIIGLTHICNLRCRYCIYSGNYSDERTHEKKEMSMETADKIVDTFFVKRKDDHPATVTFYGGEPFMNFPVISRIVKKITSLCDDVTFSVTTNGVMLKNEKNLDFLVEHDFITNISFDGPVQEKMRVNENGKGTFNELMGIIEHISVKYPDYYRQRVGFNVTITPATDLPETVKFFNTNPLFRNSTLNIIRHYDPDNTFCRKYDLQDHEKTLKDEFEVLRKQYPDVYKDNLPFHNGCYYASMVKMNQRAMGPVDHLPLNSCCYPGMNAVFVDIDGTCSACERTEHYPLGHLDREPISNEMADECVKKYYEIARHNCPECWAARLCSKCFSHVRRGTLSEENFLSNCDDFRQSLLKSLELYTSVKEKDEKAFNEAKSVEEIMAEMKRGRK
ncbi:MAG: radical SAM protein [Candidatus Xenobiia bacterium LiM19]